MSYASQVRTYRAYRNRALSPIITKLNQLAEEHEDGKLNADGLIRARKPLLAAADAACRTFDSLSSDLLARARANAIAATPAAARSRAVSGYPGRAVDYARLAEVSSPSTLLELARTMTADDAGSIGLLEAVSRRAAEPGMADVAAKLHAMLDSLHDDYLGNAVAELVVAKHEAARAKLDVDGLLKPSNMADIVSMVHAANMVQVEGCPLSSVTTAQAEGFHAAEGMSAATPSECQLPSLRPDALAGVGG